MRLYFLSCSSSWRRARRQVAGAVALGATVRSRLAPLVPLAAVAFVVARFYSFDSYYAPALRRMSDGGLVAPGLIYALLVVLAFVALVESAGH